MGREFDTALDGAHQTFRRSHPGFPVEIFDKTFLTGAAAPELRKFFTANQRPDPERLAELVNAP